jgi:glucosyl-3-phosphoglycerate synthase
VLTSEALAGWFARRTLSSDDLDLRDLIARKRAADVSISLVLPARNEAETIRSVVESGMALAGELVDEVVVLDGGSSDGTAELAVAAGATVHQDADILPQFGPVLGKGDALWRSLTVTSGDIVAFVDTDIRNPDPRFVWGIVAPLLLDDTIEFVKGFYVRPIEIDGVLHPSGGGRVTELTARPLLNLFWPQLAGLVQPLSGEYAGRRSLLENLPFFSGYAVEIGLLIDILDARGADAIAQVDVGRRVHRNQDLPSLSRMSFAIIHAVTQRLTASGRARFGETPATAYTQIARDERDRVALRSRAVINVERPPISTLPH